MPKKDFSQIAFDVVQQATSRMDKDASATTVAKAKAVETKKLKAPEQSRKR